MPGPLITRAEAQAGKVRQTCSCPRRDAAAVRRRCRCSPPPAAAERGSRRRLLITAFSQRRCIAVLFIVTKCCVKAAIASACGAQLCAAPQPTLCCTAAAAPLLDLQLCGQGQGARLSGCGNGELMGQPMALAALGGCICAACFTRRTACAGGGWGSESRRIGFGTRYQPKLCWPHCMGPQLALHCCAAKPA